jgi:polyisoprenoid-binding protein YceI
MTTTTKLSALTGDYVFDTAHTRIGFVARHTIATKVPGQFGEFEGSAHLDGDDPSRSSAQLTIAAQSIQTRSQQRDQAVRSKFLDMDNHPTITYTSTKVQQADDTSFTVTGDLTIRGVTKPVTVDLKLTGAKTDSCGNFRVGFEGSATINRKDWGVNWNAAPGVVSKKVTLEVEVAVIHRSGPIAR